jgi:hypothetical protein
VIAFKWLARGAIAPFTGFVWPKDGSWVTAPRGVSAGSGVHACHVSQLAWWIGEELWRVELAGDFVEHATQVEASRARLLEQVTAWDPAAFKQACVARTESFASEVRTAELADYVALIRTADAPIASFVDAVAAVAARGLRSAFEDERAWQAGWLARALDLREG